MWNRKRRAIGAGRHLSIGCEEQATYAFGWNTASKEFYRTIDSGKNISKTERSFAKAGGRIAVRISIVVKQILRFSPLDRLIKICFYEADCI